MTALQWAHQAARDWAAAMAGTSPTVPSGRAADMGSATTTRCAWGFRLCNGDVSGELFLLGFQMWLNVTTWIMLMEAVKVVGWGLEIL